MGMNSLCEVPMRIDLQGILKVLRRMMRHGVSGIHKLVIFDIVQDTEPLRAPNHQCQFQMLDSKWESYVRQTIVQTDNSLEGGSPPADGHGPERAGSI